MGEIKKETLAFEMAKQLHEQYAINDNAKAGNVIGFIAAIAFVFVGFGYVYAQPYLKNSLSDDDYKYLLLSAYIVANVILLFMSFMCVMFGYSTRRDHVVITRLRTEYANDECKKWFKEKFNGCGKKIIDFLPDYYKIMFVFIQIFIILLAVGCKYHKIQICNGWMISTVAIGILTNIGYWVWNHSKYNDFQTEEEKKEQTY